jgi:hypothetical protein
MFYVSFSELSSSAVAWPGRQQQLLLEEVSRLQVFFCADDFIRHPCADHTSIFSTALPYYIFLHA